MDPRPCLQGEPLGEATFHLILLDLTEVKILSLI